LLSEEEVNWNLSALTLATALMLPAASFGAAVEFTDAPVTHDTQLSLGFVFTTNQAIDITALGYYDEDGDGVQTNHEVGIFDTNGILLISTILSAGTSSLEGHYRYNAVSPITLAANSTFTVAATTFGTADGWVYGNAGSQIAGFVVDPSITVASDAARFLYQDDNVLRVPTDHFGNFTIYGGPNFKLAAVNGGEVPEPASVMLTFAGVAALLVFSRRSQAGRKAVQTN
jgi:hypothetical protein